MRKGLAIAVTSAVAAGAVALPAGAATNKRGERSFTERLSGTRLSSSGNRFEDLFRIKRSLDGGGAAIYDVQLNGTTYPVSAEGSMIAFFRDGARNTRDTFKLLAPGTDGIGSIAGNGTCVGGTGLHKFETCTYRIKGNYNVVTGVTFMTLTGTDTRRIT
ncbi:MAG: hypothetical protein JOZ07_00545 [Solirubrobacterales bacterium]|nr:hypothetical protein [Solirubrobacterales bacterium]